jgi:6-phosphofructokinase 1
MFCHRIFLVIRYNEILTSTFIHLKKRQCTMKDIKKILVLTSGGDAPGMNPAIRAVVRTGLYYGMEVFGSLHGLQGLLTKEIIPLDIGSVSNCIQRGGTILKTSRSEEFRKKPARDEVRKYLAQLGMDALIILGGDGSFRAGALLRQEGGPNVMGVPCTIDNDIVGTEYTIGFDTAVNTALSAIDKIRDTASSHDRRFMVEVMGKTSGFIAVEVGIAGGAEIILTPEFPMTAEALIEQMSHRRPEKLTSIVVAAEADHPGHTIKLANQIRALSPSTDFKVCILGHIQRGGSATAHDRRIASVMGAKAVMALREGTTDKMMAMQDGKIVVVDFPDPNNTTRYFKRHEALEINDIICR